MPPETEKLSVKEKIGYSLGDTASNLFFQTFILFLPIFYTDVFGLPAAAMGTMFLVTRIFDAVNDPIMGTIADHTKMRWGKFRPYILLFAIPFGIMGVLTFTTPGFDATGKLIYAYITYNLLMVMYTIVNVPYSALMGVITPNSLERTEVSSFRFVAAFVGGLIVQAATISLVKYFGQGNDAVGWQWAMGCLAGLAAVLLFITFATTKERVQPPKEQKSQFKRDLKDLFSNAPWLMIAGATVCQLTFIVMRQSSVAYYFKYYVRDQQLNLFGNVINLSYETFTSSFLLAGSVVTIIGVVLTKWFSKLLDKKNTYAGFLIAAAVVNAVLYVVRPQDVILIYVLNLLFSFFVGPVSVLQWAMYTDTADYSEWKNNRRATGLLMAASLFALKLGLTLGGAFVGWLLAYYGFVANQEQTPEAMNGIVKLLSIFPAIFGIAGGLLMMRYPLTNKMMVKIEEDLTVRRQEAR
ncbi:MFS transporter [candidate division KSB1 bacterium]|nr:MAG: MFS transporter [candidate division KSB1 bacterium]MBC6948159.1 MFS transporter [candidate division KSB1 bacterium]MCE7940716.1 MFS transporter [Chlorobi bacterium CHB1]MDL1874075.1 MFS transporter [Cytophagia bacterium CHB2]